MSHKPIVRPFHWKSGGVPIVVFIVISMLIGSWSYVRNRLNPFADSFPNPSEIAEVVIPIDRPLKADESVPFIRVPESEFEALSALFQDSRIDREPAKWAGFFKLEITLKNGDPMNVMVFYLGDEPGAFRVNRTYYRGGSDKDFEKFLRRVLPVGVQIAE